MSRITKSQEKQIENIMWQFKAKGWRIGKL